MVVISFLEWPKSRALTIPNTCEDVQQHVLSFTDGGTKNGIVTLKTVWQFPNKIKYTHTIQSSNHVPAFTKKEYETCPHKNPHTDVYIAYSKLTTWKQP